MDKHIEKLHELAGKIEKISQRRIDALLANLVGLWELDIRTLTLTWDDMMFYIFDVEPSTFSGAYKDYLKLLHPDDIVRADITIKNAIANPTRKLFFRQRVKRRDGYRFVWSIGQVIRDYDGYPITVIGLSLLEPLDFFSSSQLPLLPVPEKEDVPPEILAKVPLIIPKNKIENK